MTIARALSMLGLTMLLGPSGATALAQSMPQPGEGAPPPVEVVDPDISPDSYDARCDPQSPYYDPNSVADPNSGCYDPNTVAADGNGANPYAPPYDLSLDNGVADSYDDGYDPQAYTEFQDALSPYGTWLDDPVYGRIWEPSGAVVGAEFSPYGSNGYWALSEFGWTWVSSYDWGWAPFHYGRWIGRPGHPWCWVPGTIWGPAWVSWRAGGGYVGWTPLPPRGAPVPRPAGARSPWRFTLATNLGQARAPYLPARSIPGVFGHTTVVSNVRPLSFGSATTRVNAGPTRIAGAPFAPGRLASIAPQAMPKLAVQPRAGTPLAARPWAQAMARRPPAPRPPAPGQGASASYDRRPAFGGGVGGASPGYRATAVAPHPGSYAPPPSRAPVPSHGSFTPAAAPPRFGYSPPQGSTHFYAPVRSYSPPPAASFHAAPPARAYSPPPPAFHEPPPHQVAPHSFSPPPAAPPPPAHVPAPTFAPRPVSPMPAPGHTGAAPVNNSRRR
jgi:hypothetical protein